MAVNASELETHRARIREQIRIRGLANTARALGVHPSSLIRFVSGYGGIRNGTMALICSVPQPRAELPR